MGFEALATAEIAVGKPGSNDLFTKIKDNFDYLYGLSAAAGVTGAVPNSSFEIDSDSDGIPDQWTRSLYAGGSGSLETTDIAHGAQAYKFVHPGGAGNGGGYLTSDYIEAGEVAVMVGFWLKTSAAGIKVYAELLCYDSDKIALTGADAVAGFYLRTDNPTDWAFMVGFAKALPSGTRYVKIRLHGGVDDTDVAGTVYFDDVKMFFPRYSDLGSFLPTGTKTANTERTTTSGTYVKLKELAVGYKGSLRIVFDLNASSGDAVYGQIYKNGVAVGTERSTSGAINYPSYSEDIDGWVAGDLVQIYAKKTGASTAAVKNFSVRIDPDDESADTAFSMGTITFDQSV